MKKQNILTMEQITQLEIVKFKHNNHAIPDAFKNFFHHNQKAILVGYDRKLRYFLNFGELN